MVYAGWPGQGGQEGRDKPWQQADGGRWQPPDWRYRQQPHGQVNGPPQPPPGQSWPARHKALTGLLAVLALLIIAVAAHSGGSSSPGNGTTAGLTTTVSATATETSSHHATRTAAAARTTQPQGTHAATATPPAPTAPAPAPTTHAPAPTTSAPAPTTQAPAPTKSAPTTPPAAAPSTSAAPAGCHPLTNSGKCYEPGEFCRTADHGVSGVAGDGEAITCEDNDGWRWEPS
jgi:hypothetical protein